MHDAVVSSAVGPDFDGVADELYGLPLDEFTTARLGYEKRARQTGDRPLAARIHALAKPTVAAWLANQFSREHKADLEAFLELGAELREATRTLDGDQLRQLSRQQHELVAALVQQGRQLAGAAGRAVSEDTARGLEDTLRAALADDQAADLLMAGRLSQALQSDGFSPTFQPGSQAVATPPRRHDTSTAATERRREQRQQAERDLAAAKHDVAVAETAHQDAKERLTQAERSAADAGRQVQDLRQQLDAARSTQSEAEQHQRDQAAVLQRAEKTLSDAQQRLSRTQGHHPG